MEIDKSTLPTKFLWLDLEMTGLDVDKDLILEIAVEITDANLQTLATYESRIKQPKDVVLDRIQKMYGGRDIRRTEMILFKIWTAQKL